jgi:hypothetical protein
MLKLDFYSASSLKQQSTDRHIAPLGHIILIPNQPVFALSLSACLAEKQQITISVFGSTRSGLKPLTRGEHANHYITDAVVWEYRKKSNYMI